MAIPDLRAVNPEDFFHCPAGFPLTFIKVGGAGSVYDQIKAELEEKNKPDSNTEFELLPEHWTIIEAGSKLTRNEADPETGKVALFWILENSFRKLRQMYEIMKPQAEHIDRTARRYGVTPAELIWPEGDYTNMDAWVLNMSICNAGVAADNREIRKAQQKRKR